jgi:hypothetical protein
MVDPLQKVPFAGPLLPLILKDAAKGTILNAPMIALETK